MTPLDHPDSYSLGDAIDRLREEMVRLNQSIKSCQLACSVAKIKNNSRSRSFRKFARVRPARIVPRLKRYRGTIVGLRAVSMTVYSIAEHLICFPIGPTVTIVFSLSFARHISASQIDDYSSDSCASGEISQPILIPRPRSAQRLDKTLYNSTDSLVETPEEQPYRRHRRHRGTGGGGGARILMGAKAASCSDLLLDFDESSSVGRRVRLSLSPSLPPSLPPTHPTHLLNIHLPFH